MKKYILLLIIFLSICGISNAGWIDANKSGETSDLYIMSFINN